MTSPREVDARALLARHLPEAVDERGLPVAHSARVVEYDIPDRAGNGTGELGVVPLTTVCDPGVARADELAEGPACAGSRPPTATPAARWP
ncbi:hypothetical protein [Dactylosporangium sp. NPDC048998]|uniref:hypothetical protein n=1 Tax=Dactylosporangium sp. NPDC048998 TaxID=3363976 RepID=UPI003719E2BA